MIKETESITEGAATAFGDDSEGVGSDIDFFKFGNFGEVRGHDFGRGEMESIGLSTRGDGDGNFVGLGGGHDKDCMGGRLFECFEKGVEGGFRKHVDFVDNVDFVLAEAWGNDGFLAQISDIVDAVIGRGIDFDDVEVIVF